MKRKSRMSNCEAAGWLLFLVLMPASITATSLGAEPYSGIVWSAGLTTWLCWAIGRKARRWWADYSTDEAKARRAQTQLEWQERRRLEAVRRDHDESTRLARLETQAARGTVYFIGPRAGGLVKIGYTAGSVSNRLRQLQTGSSENLVVLGMRPGTMADEKALHRKHRRARVHHEWFRRTADIEREMRKTL